MSTAATFASIFVTLCKFILWWVHFSLLLFFHISIKPFFESDDRITEHGPGVNLGNFSMETVAALILVTFSLLFDAFRVKRAIVQDWTLSQVFTHDWAERVFQFNTLILAVLQAVLIYGLTWFKDVTDPGIEAGVHILLVTLCVFTGIFWFEVLIRYANDFRVLLEGIPQPAGAGIELANLRPTQQQQR
ncbi:hypothetical protein F5Y18DRAFT_427519 [Xylariaceae sp. FL1019]|nr:hypothetical protein F5Y18DRAFT_427519 [Xylariaceae sp. FL1019]